MPYSPVIRTLVALIAVVLMLPAPASAQSEPPRFSVAAGAGRAFPFHSDFPSQAFAWHASARVRTARFFYVEVAFDQWRHESSRVIRNVVLRGPVSVIGHVDEIRNDETVSIDVLGINAMLGGTVGRVTITGGGGPALVTYRDRHTQTLIGCTASTPQTCQDYSSAFSNAELGLHAAVDLSVLVASRISAFGRGHVAGPMSDPGSGHIAVVGGVRVALK